jgi:hypothetical protein
MKSVAAREGLLQGRKISKNDSKIFKKISKSFVDKKKDFVNFFRFLESFFKPVKFFYGMQHPLTSHHCMKCTVKCIKM